MFCENDARLAKRFDCFYFVSCIILMDENCLAPVKIAFCARLFIYFFLVICILAFNAKQFMWLSLTFCESKKNKKKHVFRVFDALYFFIDKCIAYGCFFLSEYALYLYWFISCCYNLVRYSKAQNTLNPNLKLNNLQMCSMHHNYWCFFR